MKVANKSDWASRPMSLPTKYSFPPEAVVILERRSSVRSPTVREGAPAAPSLTVGLLTPQAVIQLLVYQTYR